MASPDNHPVVLAIDPGRAKCGVAVVDREGTVYHRAVIATESLSGTLVSLVSHFTPETILLGDGTGAGPLRISLTALSLPAPLQMVEERHTSELARARYLAENPARGWFRLLPRALRTPETAYDDYVAVILAERWWRERAGEFEAERDTREGPCPKP